VGFELLIAVTEYFYLLECDAMWSGSLLGLLFDLKGWGNTFIQNINKFLPGYMASHVSR
jgi:hypothetical protein